MAKEIILYNLAEHVTDEEYQDYVKNEKGPLLDSLSSVKKFELVKVTGSASGDSPYKYVGIMHITSLEEFSRKDAPSQAFQEFMKKWQSMVSDFKILAGEEIY
ncbi:MAG: hypothetical protein A2158_05895 [Chloroflexi bacterium RBG_13_46_14]|nr:MAG: hypothetical protein A2158_05895 [Chloroflexi bacterium RBG_13_46_14]